MWRWFGTFVESLKSKRIKIRQFKRPKSMFSGSDIIFVVVARKHKLFFFFFSKREAQYFTREAYERVKYYFLQQEHER